MHKANSIVMRAPKREIFETAANLELWPKILPHYRYIRYLERSEHRNLVVMAATRSGIPITWTSEQIIDRENCEVRFHHLKAFTKGMHVVWTFNETPDGVLVEIVHDLQFSIRASGADRRPIIGNFFIHHVASQTLRCMKTSSRSAGLDREDAQRKTDVARSSPASDRSPASEPAERSSGRACARRRAASVASPVSIPRPFTRTAPAKFATGFRRIIFRHIG